MKIKTTMTIIVLAFLAVATPLSAQDFSNMDASPMDAASFPSSYRVSDKLIKIVYSRPQLKERSVASLAPNGKVWRTGANEAAELTLYVDMKVGGKTVKAGTYSFFTIPGEKEWTAIISSDTNVWGAYSYNEANDVARVSAPVSAGGDSLEAFSIAFTESDNGVDMNLGWGTVRVSVPFTK